MRHDSQYPLRQAHYVSHSTDFANRAFVKALTNAFGVRDPNGEPGVDTDGAIVADPELTDYCSGPMKY